MKFLVDVQDAELLTELTRFKGTEVKAEDAGEVLETMLETSGLTTALVKPYRALEMAKR